ATTGPLLQRWYSLIERADAGRAYSLFSSSNIGSFVALFGYPLVVEPLLRTRTQSVAWAVGFGVYAVAMVACGFSVWRFGLVAPAEPASVQTPTQTPEPVKPARKKRNEPVIEEAEASDAWESRLRWLGLAAVPATLMMSVTTFISTDVASIPLLWMAPLAMYLLTFVLAFAERPLVSRTLLLRLFPLALVVVVALVLAPPIFPFAMIALHLIAFFVIALACHTELAASRPPAESLTEFYLWLSAGGAVGGLFNALVAPLIFVNPYEYPLAALSGCLMLPMAAASDDREPSRVRQLIGLATTALPLLLVVGGLWIVQTFNDQIPADTATRYAVIFLPPCLAAFLLRSAPLRMGIALATIVVAGAFVRFDNRVPIHLERSFFGVHRVLATARERVLLSGTTNHGAQSVNPSLACEPLSYYSRQGAVGQVFAALQSTGRPRNVGVVGLGTATLAAYAKPDQRWTFFDINPVVERLARENFSYLKSCAPNAQVVIGDARLQLAHQPDGAFDVLVLDAFSSDSIPVHLMTKEAFELYFRTLSPNGLLLVHVSNRFLDLGPVVGAVARSLGYSAITQFHAPSNEELEISSEISAARWVLVARSSSDREAMMSSGKWVSLDDTKASVWTDDYSNVVGVMRW
ncbi:MAG: fused MFS/spermidine synthase, partial [Vicinamibacterales bacterium]